MSKTCSDHNDKDNNNNEHDNDHEYDLGHVAAGEYLEGDAGRGDRRPGEESEALPHLHPSSFHG